MNSKQDDVVTKLEKEYFMFVENIEKMCGIKNSFLPGMPTDKIAEILPGHMKRILI